MLGTIHTFEATLHEGSELINRSECGFGHGF